MSLPATLNIALKEWATTIQALSTGRQILLLRKGGILEQSTKNRFAITHNEFLLFPTYLHQSRGQLKPEVHFEPAAAEPNEIHLTAAASVTDIFKIESRKQIDRLDAHHIWTDSLIDMRFNYKPQNPLYLVLVRTYRLPAEIALPNTVAYAGCKSWVPLEHPIPTDGATAILNDAEYDRQRKQILDRLEHP